MINEFVNEKALRQIEKPASVREDLYDVVLRFWMMLFFEKGIRRAFLDLLFGTKSFRSFTFQNHIIPYILFLTGKS